MAKQWSIQDPNQFPALIAHTGTAGTADTERVVSTNGALNVSVQGTVPTTASVAMADLPGGTIDYIASIGGTVTTTASVAMTDIPGGTLDVLSSGSITNIGMLHGGTVVTTM